MQKDLKIGMLLGLVMVMVIMAWLSTGPSLSPKAARPAPRSPSSTGGTRTNPPPHEYAAAPNNFSTNILTIQTAENNQSKPQDLTKYSAGHPTVEQTEKIKTQKFHIVRKGETLSEISYKYYGSASKWRILLDANRNVIEDANKLRPGTKLIVPE